MKIFLFYFLVHQSLAFAIDPSIYPVVPQGRLFGTDQGTVPSCAANAEVTALEHAFAAKKIPINFSQYYRHECIYINALDDQRKKMCLQSVTPEDTCIYKKIGEFAPEYMFPEDNERNQLSDANGLRPPAKIFGVFNGLPHLNDFGYQSKQYTFAKNKEGQDYANTRTVTQMLELFSQGKAVTIGVHGELFASVLNAKTGLLNTKYEKQNFISRAVEGAYKVNADPRKNYLEAIEHGVAVVGYDLNFYSEHQYPNPGAIFVRNSWNDQFLKNYVNSSSSPEELVDLNKFRLKLHSRNLPGYYAVPIQYFMDQEGDKTHFTVIELNFGEYFNKYREVQRDYETAVLPYLCEVTYKENDNISSNLGTIQSTFRSYLKGRSAMRNAETDEDRTNARTLVLEKLQFITDQTSQRGLKFAKFAIYKGDTSVVRKFYAGDFNEYYCAKSSVIPIAKLGKVTIVKNQVWPTLKMFDEDETLRLAIEQLGRNSGGITGRIQFADILGKEIIKYKIGE